MKGKVMKLNEVFVNFKCEVCGRKYQISITEILEVGHPMCCDCKWHKLLLEPIDVEIVAP